MARTTGSDGARTEEAIRQAAIELIAARGFEAMTLRELADEETANIAQLESARRSLKLSQARYEAGYVGFLEVLDAQRTTNIAQLTYLNSRKNRLNAAVDLFRALGGGWREDA